MRILFSENYILATRSCAYFQLVYRLEQHSMMFPASRVMFAASAVDKTISTPKTQQLFWHDVRSGEGGNPIVRNDEPFVQTPWFMYVYWCGTVCDALEDMIDKGEKKASLRLQWKRLFPQDIVEATKGTIESDPHILRCFWCTSNYGTSDPRHHDPRPCMWCHYWFASCNSSNFQIGFTVTFINYHSAGRWKGICPKPSIPYGWQRLPY